MIPTRPQTNADIQEAARWLEERIAAKELERQYISMRAAYWQKAADFCEEATRDFLQNGGIGRDAALAAGRKAWQQFVALHGRPPTALRV